MRSASPATTDALRETLGVAAPSGEEFYAKLGGLSLEGVSPRTGHFIDIVGNAPRGVFLSRRRHGQGRVAATRPRIGSRRRRGQGSGRGAAAAANCLRGRAREVSRGPQAVRARGDEPATRGTRTEAATTTRLP